MKKYVNYSLLLTLFFSVAFPVSAGKRVALVIGNADYSIDNGRLANPVNDAKSLTERLREIGFKVLYKPNLANREAMETAVEDFSSQISDAEVALFYYSGHGVQRDGKNYLMPTQAKINNARQIRHRAMSVSFLMDEVTTNTQGLSLIILDACRNDPYPHDSRSTATRGLARINAPSGTIIAYATEAGTTASDGIGNHSPYTSQLLNYLNTHANQPIDDVMNKVSVAVEDATNRLQSPRIEMSPLRNIYCFTECANSTTPTPTILAPAMPPSAPLLPIAQDRNTQRIAGYMDKGRKFLYEKGRPEKALIFFNKALALDRVNAQIYYELGAANIELFEYAEAIEQLKQAIKYDPDNKATYKKLAFTFAALGDDAKAAYYRQYYQ